MISGAVKMVSVWNKGTFPRIKELKDCKFLGGVNKTDSVLSSVKGIQQRVKTARVPDTACKKPATRNNTFYGCNG